MAGGDTRHGADMVGGEIDLDHVGRHQGGDLGEGDAGAEGTLVRRVGAGLRQQGAESGRRGEVELALEFLLGVRFGGLVGLVEVRCVAHVRVGNIYVSSMSSGITPGGWGLASLMAFRGGEARADEARGKAGPYAAWVSAFAEMTILCGVCYIMPEFTEKKL